MNTPVLSLLRTLDALGIHSVGFRILSHGKSLRHTSPVALTTQSTRRGAPVSLFSISDLFAAYSLTPRKGEYVLNVDDGCLAFLPETAQRPAKPIETHANALRFSRTKPRDSRRRARHGDRLAA